MPQPTQLSRLLRQHLGWRWFCLLVVIVLCTGCRTFRCKKESDESIALTRQLSLQGKDAQQKEQWEKAESYFAEAVQRSPKDERARCGYAESLWQRGSQEQAVTHMVEAVKLSGDDPDRLVQLGQMYLAQNNLPAAARQADRAIAANKQLASAWALRANVYQASGQREEALAAYHRTLSFEPHFPEVQLSLAEIYSQTNRPQRALATLQSLADQYPPGSVPAEVMFQQGLVLRQLGRNQDAAECLAAAAQSQPSAELLYELAYARMLVGDMANATAALNGSLQINPSYLPAVQMRQQLASRQPRLAGMPGLQR